jgi:hypothetical protein
MTELTTMRIFKNETSYDRTWRQSNKKISRPPAKILTEHNKTQQSQNVEARRR